MARPEMIECEVCGTEVPVAARGPVPRFCAEHRSNGVTVEAAEPADEPADEPVDDGWPQQVAPLVWVGPNGERWTDLGEAERACAEWRKSQR